MSVFLLEDTRWRDTGRKVLVGPFDGRLLFFFVFFMLYPSRITFYSLCISFGLFYTLQYFGYDLPNARRKLMIYMSGKKKNGIHYWRVHKYR